MAKAHSTHLLRGKIGNLIYRVRDGRQLVHLAPAPWQEATRYKRRLRFDSFRLNVEQFAGASAVSSGLYRQLFSDLKEFVRPYTHNRLTARLKRTGDIHHRTTATAEGHVHASPFRVFDAWKAFRDLDLSHEGAPTRQVTMTPVGPQHNPTAIRLSGLRDAARAIQSHGNARLEARIHVRQADIREMAFHPEHREWRPLDPENTAPQRRHPGARPSGWIPAEALPAGDITLPLPGRPDGDRFATAVIIEWREVREVDGREVPHPRKAIARIAAIHGTPEDFTEPLRTRNHGDPDHPSQDPNAFTPKTDWRQQPQEYLQEAILHIRT
jgi:hypothetical protein